MQVFPLRSKWLIHQNDEDQLSNVYAAQHPVVVVDSYTHPNFMYPREMYATLHLELVKITHLSEKTGRRLRGSGLLRASDFKLQIECPSKNTVETLQSVKHEAEEVTVTLTFFLI